MVSEVTTKNLKELEKITNSNLYSRGNSILIKSDPQNNEILKSAIQFLANQFINNGSVELNDSNLIGLSQSTNLFTSSHPNAGLPNAFGKYDQTPEEMVRQLKEYLDENLVNIIESVKKRDNSKIHSSTKVFQAIRIEVNDEIKALKDLSLIHI